jgi:hypothetical protein
MKTIFRLTILAGIIAALSCNKDPYVITSHPIGTLTSLQSFKDKHRPPNMNFFVNGNAGGSFTTPQGTTVVIPGNAFMDQNANPYNDLVHIEFLDVYKKSDMFWTGMTTQMTTGEPLKSAGEFYIKAMDINGNALLLQQNIEVQQPLNNQPLDTAMLPFLANDSANNGWLQAPSCTLWYAASNYVFSMYQFNTPLDSGSWCNSDNPSYFANYNQTVLMLHSASPVSEYHPDVFLVFAGVNSMVHVYQDYQSPANYPYDYAPIGLACTVVAIGEKDGKLYSSFVPTTVGVNQTINFTMSETTEDAFKAAIEALD